MKLLVLGDSITDCNHCFTPDNLGEGYVKQLSLLAGANWQITNAGTDGFTLRRIREKWEQQYRNRRYDIVLILGGINDVAVAADTRLDQSSAAAFLEDSARNLQHLVRQLLDGGMTVIVTEPFLLTPPAYLLRWRPYLEQLNARIRDELTDFRKNTSDETCTQPKEMLHTLRVQPMLDELCAVYGAARITLDGVHLTQFGHERLAEYIWQFFSVV